MIVLYGPKGSEKTTFLNCVERLQNGGASISEALVPENISELLSRLARASYQCVRLEAEGQTMPLSRLDIALPLALAGKADRSGLSKGNKILVLCDDTDFLFRHDQETNRRNELYLKELAQTLDHEKTMTFLGTTTLGGGHWDPNVLDPWHVANVGWD